MGAVFSTNRKRGEESGLRRRSSMDDGSSIREQDQETRRQRRNSKEQAPDLREQDQETRRQRRNSKEQAPDLQEQDQETRRQRRNSKEQAPDLREPNQETKRQRRNSKEEPPEYDNLPSQDYKNNLSADDSKDHLYRKQWGLELKKLSDLALALAKLIQPAEQYEAKNISLTPGGSVIIEMKIRASAREFEVSLGEKEEDLALHFKSQFSGPGSRNIVLNSRHAGRWQSEQRYSNFPFQQDTDTKVVINFSASGFEVELPDGQKLSVPNRQGFKKLTYMSVKGHICVKSLKIQ